MSDSVGLAYVAQHMNPYLAAAQDGVLQRDCSEATAREIDEEVKKILDAAYLASKHVLLEHRSQLDLVANALLEPETLDAPVFESLIGETTAIAT